MCKAARERSLRDRQGIRMLMRHFLAAALIASAGFTARVHAASAAAYDYYSSGNLKAATPGKTEGALLLLGGGDWPVPAFRWFVEKMGHGHLVILRASGSDDLQKDFIDEVGGAASVETIVFHSRDAASDPRVLRILKHADGIFFGGG